MGHRVATSGIGPQRLSSLRNGTQDSSRRSATSAGDAGFDALPGTRTPPKQFAPRASVGVVCVVSCRTEPQTENHNEAPASSGQEKEVENGRKVARDEPSTNRNSH
jgi:hypothetical protein